VTISCPQFSPRANPKADGGNCAKNLYGGKPSFGICLHVCEFGPRLTPPKPEPVNPLPRAEWPIFITKIASYLKGDDKGVGDSVRRAADALGHKVVVAGLRACGIKCSCDERLDSVVAYLNARFPYPQPTGA
jgi:hypothetical protein